MKNAFSSLVLVMLGVLSLSMGGCAREEEKPDPVKFISANPPNGSEIQPDATVSVVFDGVPVNAAVTPGTAKTVGQTVTISGPFTVGPLNLVITWSGDARVLNYTVNDPVPEGMVLIPAGEFQMGSVDGDNDEQPVHTVYVDAFFIDEHEVTNLDYKRFVLANPRWSKDRIDRKFHNENYLRHWNGNNYPNGKGNHPVVHVSWYAAMAYAGWVEKRLPTEAEWERAARGGLEGKKYPWGNVIHLGKANYDRNVDDTTPVGGYPPNAYGLYDMAGNVWEWCLDEYDENFYFRSPRENPLSGANNVEWIINNFTGVKSSRVLRGGSRLSLPRDVRVANRLRAPPTGPNFNLGFRCARALTP